MRPAAPPAETARVRPRVRSLEGEKQPPSLMDVAKSAADDLLDLLAAQIKLAKLELSADLRGAVRRLARIAVFIPPLLIGYAFGMSALASWLSAFWGTTAALASVAAMQIVPAGLGIFLTLAALRKTHVLERTSTDVVESVQDVIASVSGPSAEKALGNSSEKSLTKSARPSDG